MDKLKDGQKDRKTDGKTERRADRLMDPRIEMQKSIYKMRKPKSLRQQSNCTAV